MCSFSLFLTAAGAEPAVNPLDGADMEAGRVRAHLAARGGGGRERPRGDVDDAAAAIAHRVVVRLEVRVEARGRAEAERARQAGLRERVERVVNGREGHRREVVPQ